MAAKKMAERGPRGATGRTGPAGPAGPQGPRVLRADILVAVDNEFREIQHFETQAKHFDSQLVRTGQIQQQLDQIQGLLKQLLEQSGSAR